MTLLKDRLLRDDLAQRGHQLVMEHFTFEKFAEIISRTVETVLAGAPAGVQRVDDQTDASGVSNI